MGRYRASLHEISTISGRQIAGLGYRQAKRVVIAIAGGTSLMIGAVLLILPGPGTLFVLAGLGILSLEFVWARHWLKRAKKAAATGRQRARGIGTWITQSTTSSGVMPKAAKSND